MGPRVAVEEGAAVVLVDGLAAEAGTWSSGSFMAETAYACATKHLPSLTARRRRRDCQSFLIHEESDGESKEGDHGRLGSVDPGPLHRSLHCRRLPDETPPITFCL